MAYIDPDNPNRSLVAEIVRVYEDAAQKLRDLVLNPPGKTASAQMYNQASAASRLAQVQAEIDRLKKQVSPWTSKALQTAVEKGLKVAKEQLSKIDVVPTPSSAVPPGPPISGSASIERSAFNLVPRRAIEILARDTVGDLFKAADSMQRQAAIALRHMAATGVSRQEVNRILAGAMIEGKPAVAVRQLRTALEKVHGKKITITDKNGDPMEFDSGYYARMVAGTKMRAATVTARHAGLADAGIDLVKIIGRMSKNPCTRLLGHIFSLSGESKKYPAFSTVSLGQMPYRLFHPNCSKSTAPYVESLAKLHEARLAREGRGEGAAEAA